MAAVIEQQSINNTISAMLPDIKNRAAEIEQCRRIPQDLVDSLRDAGLFRMLLPDSHGGLGYDFPSSVALLRDLASADGAVGWSMMISNESPQLFALLPRETFDAVYAAGPDATVAGTFAPKGQAMPVDGGYRASGRWSFASGCEYSDWLFGNCVVPPATADAAPSLRCVLLPREQWQIHDTWHTSGLRGTGSQDISLDDVFVDEGYSFDLFGGQPCINTPIFALPIAQFSLHIGAVALGIAEGAHEDLIALATTGKKRLYGRTPMTESELFQFRLGDSEAELRAMEALLFRQTDEFWTQAQDGTLTPALLPRVLQAVSWVARSAAAVVTTCYHAGGGSVIYDKSPLQRRLRDIHTLSQHASVQESLFANNGAALLGVEQAFSL